MDLVLLPIFFPLQVSAPNILGVGPRPFPPAAPLSSRLLCLIVPPQLISFGLSFHLW